MAHPSSDVSLLTLLKLLLFFGIFNGNLSMPSTRTLSIELSSPAPFTKVYTITSDGSSSQSPSPSPSPIATSIAHAPAASDGTAMPEVIELNHQYDYDNSVADVDKSGGSPSETDESGYGMAMADGESTSPTSVEQHDQPLVPPTTLSFAYVAEGGGASAGANDAATTQDDATPPYAAVDDKYVPTKPQNLTVLAVGSNSITMSWHPPKNQNGAIAGYHVFHIHENQTGVEIVKNPRNSAESTITFVLPNLKPYTEYLVIVKAFTTKNEGDPSDQILQRTDVAAPSAPILVNVSCLSMDAISVRWRRPIEFYNTIDYYVVKVRLVGQDSHKDIRINASTKELETKMVVQNLTTNSIYEVKVGAATSSVIDPKNIIPGKYSEPKSIHLQPNCEKIQPLLRQSHNEYNLAVLVGVIFSCFGIVLIVMAFFLWRKCFHAAYYYLDDPPHHPNVPQVDWEVPVEVGGEIRAAVPVNEFAKHVASLHADGDIGFSREYEAIQNECVSDELPCEHSQHPENKRKNRYLNITAYDHSRVHLHPAPGQKKSIDYINANYIDGYQKSRAFIGTQGPLPDTFDCFWRMIWEQRVAIIVMITNLVERGRRKCDMYWPKDGVETYGVVQVKLVEEEVMATYTVRTLQIKHLKLKKKKQANVEKIVYQYHYTNWPDHGTPDHPLPVLDFVKKSSAANPADAGPIVVHCSAGVGRTGTYIVLDAMLKQIAQKGVVNVFGFLRHIRIQRNFLVQTEEQYIFIHDALVEAIASADTNLSPAQVEELMNCTPYLEQQYKNIIQFQTKDIHIASAMKQVNSIKNRGAIFPIEGSRVHLTPKPGEDGSDYINGSWLHGFRRLRDFIVTQHPMAHTVKDFWQMVWDHNAQTIVLLSSLDEINFAQFWPTDDTTPIESDYYRVRFLNKTNKSDYVSRDFVIQSIQDDYELSVKMLHCPSWPEMSNPKSIYDFIVDVHERCTDYRNGPIVIVDRYGGAQACTFCAISSLAIEMEYCNTANVYQYAKLYHNKRPGVWTSSEDIRLIYNILSLMPRNLQLLKRTALRTEFEDVTTATPDLYSKICNNGNVHQQQQQIQKQLQLQLQQQQQQNHHQSPQPPQQQQQTQINCSSSSSSNSSDGGSNGSGGVGIGGGDGDGNNQTTNNVNNKNAIVNSTTAIASAPATATISNSSNSCNNNNNNNHHHNNRSHEGGTSLNTSSGSNITTLTQQTKLTNNNQSSITSLSSASSLSSTASATAFASPTSSVVAGQHENHCNRSKTPSPTNNIIPTNTHAHDNNIRPKKSLSPSSLSSSSSSSSLPTTTTTMNQLLHHNTNNQHFTNAPSSTTVSASSSSSSSSCCPAASAGVVIATDTDTYPSPLTPTPTSTQSSNNSISTIINSYVTNGERSSIVNDYPTQHQQQQQQQQQMYALIHQQQQHQQQQQYVPTFLPPMDVGSSFNAHPMITSSSSGNGYLTQPSPSSPPPLMSPVSPMLLPIKSMSALDELNRLDTAIVNYTVAANTATTDTNPNTTPTNTPRTPLTLFANTATTSATGNGSTGMMSQHNNNNNLNDNNYHHNNGQRTAPPPPPPPPPIHPSRTTTSTSTIQRQQQPTAAVPDAQSLDIVG